MINKTITTFFLLFLVFLTACRPSQPEVQKEPVVVATPEKEPASSETGLTQEDLSDVESSSVKDITTDELTSDLEADLTELSELEENI